MNTSQGSDSVIALLVVLGLLALAGLLFRRRPARALPPDPWAAESSDTDATDAPDGPERLSCPHCLEPNDPQAPFCVSCGSPIGDTVTLDPLKQIRAQGWVWQEAVNRPYRGLVLLGLWMLVLAELAAALVPLLVEGASGGPLLAALLQVLAGLAFATIILHKATRNYLRRHRA